MSWRALQYIRDTYRGPNKYLLMIMASYARTDGTNIYPSVGTLAFDAGVSERYVRQQIAELVACGAIERTRYSVGGNQTHTCRYAIRMEGTPEPQFTPEPLFTPEPQFHRPLNPSSVTPEPQFSRKVKKGKLKGKKNTREKTRGGVSVVNDDNPNRPVTRTGLLRDGTDPLEGTSLDTPEFRLAWCSWIDYRRERRLARWVDRTMLAKIRTLAEHGPERAAATITRSIENGWSGLFPDNPGATGNQGKPRDTRTLVEKSRSRDEELKK